MKKVLLLDNYDSFTYNLVHYIEANLDIEINVFRNDKITIEKVNEYDTIILSPGPGLPKDAGILNEVIATYAPTKKILGVCLGMQAIGKVFGGRLINLDTTFHGIATPIQILDTNDPLFKGIPHSFNVGRYHSWIIDNKHFPTTLKITSIDENRYIMSLKHQKFELYGVQFHPESILSEYGKKIIDNFLSI